jgi:hypothetical protein
MRAARERRLILVWAALFAVTLAQLGIGGIEGHVAVARSSWIPAIAIGIALFKVRVILREFMEVRHAPVRLGRLTDLWIVLTAAILLLGHLAGTAFAKG